MSAKQWMLGLALAGAMIVGCEDKSSPPPLPRPTPPSSNAIHDAGDAAKSAGENLKDAAKDTGEAIKKTGEAGVEKAKELTTDTTAAPK